MDVNAKYTIEYSRYAFLLSRMQALLPSVMENAGIEVVGVFGRLKTLQSFSQKAERKGYGDVFAEITDFCGVRIIHYLMAERTAVIDAIKACGLVVVEEVDKRKALSPTEFGYSAHHLIVKMPESWLEDHIKHLQKYPIEIQVTTIAEHIWSYTSHRTTYKNDSVSDEQKRRLTRLASALEDVEERVDSILQLAPKGKTAGSLTASELRGFLSYAFPDREKIQAPDIHGLLQNIIHHVPNKAALESYWLIWKSHFVEIEGQIFDSLNLRDQRFREDGALKVLLDLSNESYWEEHKNYTPVAERKVIERWRDQLLRKTN